MLSNFFNTFLYQPLFNALVLLYEYLPGHDFGIAIILLTLLIKVLFYPLGTQAIRSQKTLSELQPKIKEIQKKYKDNKEAQAKATMELYQEAKISPFSGCLPILIQLPILIALYRVFWKGLIPEELAMLYPFVPSPGEISPYFLGIVNLAKANTIFAILAGALQFIQTKMAAPKSDKSSQKESQTGQFSDILQKQSLYFFPFFTVIILLRLPAAIGLYWIATTVFSILQQYLIFKKPKTEKL